MPRKPLYLTTSQHSNTDSNATLIVGTTSYPGLSIEMTPEAWRVFRSIWYFIQSLGRGMTFTGRQIPDALLVYMLNFINPDNLSFLMNQMRIVSQRNFPVAEFTPDHDGLSLMVSTSQTTEYQYRVASFFAYPRDIQSLSTASLNADLDTVRYIVESNRPEKLRNLLFQEATATYTHLEEFKIIIKRTGKPLQMAIFADDEGLQELYRELFERLGLVAEFERQAIEAFSTVLPEAIKARLAREGAPASAYQEAMVKQQQIHARTLCENFEAVIRNTDSAHFIDPAHFIAPAPNYIAHSTSADANNAATTLYNSVLGYTQAKPMHNRYILLQLAEFYENLPTSFARDCFFSQKGFSPAQVFMPLRWLHHQAAGIYNIAQNAELLKGRSVICVGSAPPVDIRSFLPRLLAGDCFLSMWGGWAAARVDAEFVGDVGILVSSKNRMQSELVLLRAAEPSSRRCIVQ